MLKAQADTVTAVDAPDAEPVACAEPPLDAEVGC